MNTQNRRKMIHDLVKDGLDHKTAKKLVDNFGDDPIAFSINYSAAMHQSKPNMDLNIVPPVFRIKDTYSMTEEQSTEIFHKGNIVNRGAW